MKRSELTVAIMNDRGFYPINPNDMRMKDIVYNIQTNKYWEKFRMTEDTEHRWESYEYGMCSTYKVRKKKEFLEVFSSYTNEWYKVAYRFVEVCRTCVYAD